MLTTFISSIIALMLTNNALYAQDSELDQVRKKISEIEKKTSVGFGTIKFDGLIQIWGTKTQNDKDSIFEDDDTFRLRRAEIKITGDVLQDTIKWGTMFDPARAIGANESTNQAKRILQDMWITLEFPKVLGMAEPKSLFSLDVGQFKIPVSMEGYGSSGKLDFLERATIARTFGDKRDIGLLARGDFDSFLFQLGLFNGEGQNVLNDENDQKNFNGRILIRPAKLANVTLMKGLQIGFSFQDGDTGVNRASRDRNGFELAWEFESLLKEKDSLWLKGEYLSGKDGSVRPMGWYGSIGYMFIPKWEVAVRYDKFDPDRQVGDNVQKEWTLGINHFFQGHNVKLQLNYVIRKEEQNSIDNNAIMAGMQISF